MKKFGRFFGQSPKNNDIRLRRAKALRSESFVVPVKIKIPVATADMRRHSDTLRGANATTKTRFTGRKQNKRSEFCCLPVVPRKWGSTGEKTTERASCEVRLLSSRLNLSSCLNFVPALPERVARGDNRLCLLSPRQNKNLSFPGHAPGKDTLRAANAATKERFTGRKQNKRSEFCCLPRPYQP